MSKFHDIAIAGAGPAGLAAALYLKRAGHKVTIFERFDEPKPV
ncbi:FAD-dependent oxidoreductase, partial [Mesorhizobium sp. M2E.F.Ca.ET.209.01.1.1]